MTLSSPVQATQSHRTARAGLFVSTGPSFEAPTLTSTRTSTSASFQLLQRRLPAAYALCALFLGACLDSSREQGLYSSYILPANTTVPRLEDDPDAAKKLDANDGLGTMVMLHTAYEAGGEVQYWDFGTLAAVSLKPMYIFRRRGDMATDLSQDANHPDLIDAIPGDTAYSPLRQIYVVYVTDAYAGERITSLRALEDAVDKGLVMSPHPTTYFVNCVVTLSTVQMQMSDDGTSVGPQDVYYHGQLVKQFCIGGLYSGVGAIALNKDGSFTPDYAYLVRRENENQPLDETLLKTDLNSDGDLSDTNVIFTSPVGRDMSTYSGIWRDYDVVVPRSFKLGDAKAESDLFDRNGNVLASKANVIGFTDTGMFLNRPIKYVPPPMP
jgi:hypothetical protein